MDRNKFIYEGSEGITIIRKSAEMKKVVHRFLYHQLNSNTNTLIIGTFNPDAKKNDANFFYSRGRNYLWQLVPVAFSEKSLKGASRHEKEDFCARHRIDFVDLIKEVLVHEGEDGNYYDGYLDKQEVKWRDINSLIDALPQLERVCFTRSTSSDIPNMNKRVIAIEEYCKSRGIYFERLVTPARFYNTAKQEAWTKFLHHDNG